MPKIKSYIQSDEAAERNREYHKRKAAAYRAMWTYVKHEHPDVFKQGIDIFNAEYEEKITAGGLI